MLEDGPRNEMKSLSVPCVIIVLDFRFDKSLMLAPTPSSGPPHPTLTLTDPHPPISSSRNIPIRRGDPGSLWTEQPSAVARCSDPWGSPATSGHILLDRPSWSHSGDCEEGWCMHSQSGYYSLPSLFRVSNVEYSNCEYWIFLTSKTTLRSYISFA